MNESEALREIRRLGRTGVLIFSDHARHRMLQRDLGVPDVRNALRRATTVTRSLPDQASDWTAKGPDVFGDELTLGIVLRGGIIIVTVY